MMVSENQHMTEQLKDKVNRLKNVISIKKN
jgi:hypothetical protein